MKLGTIVRAAFVERHLLREAADPHPKGGVYTYRTTVQGVREALVFLLNKDVRLGRVVKLGLRDPGQMWLVEVYKRGSNSLEKQKPEDPEDSTYFYDPNQGVPSAIIVYHHGDQLTWTGDVYESFEAALAEHSGTQLVNQ
jgi:hypothetical protein